MQLKIISYIPPNPWFYVRLAGVSKLFYSRLTSDELWKQLDVYVWGKDICLKFLSSDFPGQFIRDAWRDEDPSGPNGGAKLFLVQPECYNYNRFVLLGYLSFFDRDRFPRTRNERRPVIDNEPLMHAATRMNPQSLEFVANNLLRENNLVVEDTVKRRPSLLALLPLWLVESHRDLLLWAIESKKCNLLETVLKLPNLAFDDAFLLRASESMDGLIELFGKLGDERDISPLARFKCAFYHPLSRYYSKREVEQILSRNIESLHDDTLIYRLCVSSAPRMLKFASERIRDTEEIVLLAVRSDGLALRHASPRLCADPQICFEAIKSKGFAIAFITQDLALDEAFIARIDFSKFNANDFMVLPVNLWDNFDVVSHAIRTSVDYYPSASERIRQNKHLVLEAIKIAPAIYQYLTPETKRDEEIVGAAISQDATLLEYVPVELRSSEVVAHASISEDNEDLRDPLRETKRSRTKR